MQGTLVTDKVHKTQLEHYLQTIDWNNKLFTENELRAMLGAACMRYLAGLTKIEFVLELSEAIRNKQYEELTHEFQVSTDMLHNIAETVHDGGLHAAEAQKHISTMIQHIQKTLTGISVTTH